MSKSTVMSEEQKVHFDRVGSQDRPDGDHLAAQFSAVGVDWMNDLRAEQLGQALKRQDAAFEKAIGEVSKLEEFVGNPGEILGNPSTKHGEIAERVEVYMRRAHDHVSQRTAEASFEGVGRFAPEDYVLGDTSVQSKYVNGARRTLDHVIKHKAKYPEYGDSGGFYHVPQDQYETIREVLESKTHDRLSLNTIERIREKVEVIEDEFGRPVEDVLRSGRSEYGDVQLGEIEETIDQEVEDLREAQEERVDEIRAEAGPSLSEGLKATAAGAAVGAGLRVTGVLYQKYRSEGKNPFRGDFSADDWKELGVEGGKGGVTGGVSGGGLYVMTNYSDAAAPFAAAVVSSGLAVGKLGHQYRQGKIEFEQFVDLSHIACTEAACVAVGTGIGQTLIPIPILGGVVGSTSAKILTSMTKDHLEEQENDLIRRLDRSYDEFRQRIDEEQEARLAEIEAEMSWLGDVTDAAFDPELNTKLLLRRSVDLARAHDVAEKSILCNSDDVDQFMGVESHEGVPGT